MNCSDCKNYCNEGDTKKKKSFCKIKENFTMVPCADFDYRTGNFYYEFLSKNEVLRFIEKSLRAVNEVRNNLEALGYYIREFGPEFDKADERLKKHIIKG